MTAHIYSVIGSDDIEVECPKHGVVLSTENADWAQWMARVHDSCRNAAGAPTA